MKLPNAVKADGRIAVICNPALDAAEAARKAGASIVAEDELIKAIKEGDLDFDALLCHSDSQQKMNKAGLGRILGPKGLMPSSKTGTIVKNAAATIRGMLGAAEYREKMGVVRLSVGQLGFTPDQLQANIKAFMANLKSDIDQLQDTISKEIHEVVCFGQRYTMCLATNLN